MSHAPPHPAPRCASHSQAAEPAIQWPRGDSQANIDRAHQCGLPDVLPVTVLCIHVDANGRELSRTNGIGRMKLTDWLENHFSTIDEDAAFYVEKGYVKLTVVYCGDLL